MAPFCNVFAEGEGFKPPIPERGIPDFESSAIDHSANLPIKREQKRVCSHFVEREEGQLKTEPSDYVSAMQACLLMAECEEGQLEIELSFSFCGCKGTDFF